MTITIVRTMMLDILPTGFQYQANVVHAGIVQTQYPFAVSTTRDLEVVSAAIQCDMLYQLATYSQTRGCMASSVVVDYYFTQLVVGRIYVVPVSQQASQTYASITSDMHWYVQAHHVIFRMLNVLVVFTKMTTVVAVVVPVLVLLFILFFVLVLVLVFAMLTTV